MVMFPVSPAPQYTRRVSSLYSSSVMSSTEMSPKLRSSKSYSKWEKQEIEAEAIARLRRKAEEKDKARVEAEAKEAVARKLTTAPAPAPALPAGPSPALTKSDEKPSVIPQIAASPFTLPLPPKADTQVTDPIRPPPLFTLSSNTQSGEAKGKPETKTTQSFPSFSFPPAPIHTAHTSASTPAASGTSTIPNPFAQNPPPTTTPSLAVTKGTTTPSFFGFGQTKPPESNPTNVSSTSQGNGPAPPSLFSFTNPTSSTSTTTSSDLSANAPSAGETGDTSKPKFKFAITNKQAAPPYNPSPAAATSSDPPKLTFSFGLAKGSSTAPTVQPTAHTPGNATTTGATTSQVNQPSVFGTTDESKPAGFSSLRESASLATQGARTEAATGESTGLFGRSAKMGDANTKPSPFGPTNGPFFSMSPAPGSSGTNPEPRKTAPVPFIFTPNAAPPTPNAVPPTPGSVFSDSAAKGPQNVEPMPQLSFGPPKSAATGTGGSGTFTFGQPSAPAPFAFGSQKS